MRRRTTRYGSWAGAGNLLIGLWLVLVLLDMASAETLSETSQDMELNTGLTQGRGIISSISCLFCPTPLRGSDDPDFL